MSSTTSPFGLMESKFFFPPYVQRGDFLWPELWFISKHIILWGRGGEKTRYFFGIYFALPRLFLIFQIICGMSALPDFSCEEKKRKRKITLSGSDLELNMEKEAPVKHSIYLQQTPCRDALTTDSTLPETNADSFFQKSHIFHRIWFWSLLCDCLWPLSFWKPTVPIIC